jgi:hypothetical protein
MSYPHSVIMSQSLHCPKVIEAEKKHSRAQECSREQKSAPRSKKKCSPEHLSGAPFRSTVFHTIIIRWLKPPMPIAAPPTLLPTLPLPLHCQHYRHRHCHRSADHCRYVDNKCRIRRAPSPLPLHVVASWKGLPSSLRGKGLTRLLLMILSNAAGLRLGGKGCNSDE